MTSMMALSAQGDILYSLIGALILVIIGFALVLKAGSKAGWLFIAGAAIWAYYSVQPIIEAAHTRATPEQSSRGYYRLPKK